MKSHRHPSANCHGQAVAGSMDYGQVAEFLEATAPLGCGWHSRTSRPYRRPFEPPKPRSKPLGLAIVTKEFTAHLLDRHCATSSVT